MWWCTPLPDACFSLVYTGGLHKCLMGLSQDSGCQVKCTVCKTKNMSLDFSFDAQVVSSHLTPQVYQLYLACNTERQVNDARKTMEERLFRAEQELKVMKRSVSLSDQEAKVELHTSTIADKFMVPRCPACNAFVPDFEGCCAIECDGCSGMFCAWCVEIFQDGSDCHDHVQICKYNPPSNR